MPDSDLVAVRAESVPRSKDCCNRVAGHAESGLRLMGAAVLWILVALIAWSIPLFLALLFLPAPWTPSQVNVVLGSAGAAFVLAWVAFVLLVLRKRRERRRLVRDGELVHGTIVDRGPGKSRRATVQFGVDGTERRVIVRVSPEEGGGTVPVLALPGADHVLVFAGAGGRGHIATVRRDVVVDRTAHRAAVVFTRGVTETFFAVVLALVALDLPLVVFAGTRIPLTRLTCERSHDACQVESFDIFGGSSAFSFHISDLQRSAVHKEEGESEWIVFRKTGRAIELTGRTGDAAQAKMFEARSQAFAAFLADPSQPTLALEYRAGGRPPLPALIAISVGALLLVLRWAHGRRTTLTIDRRAGTLSIHRQPALVPPATRTLPLASISRVAVKPGALFLLYAMLPTLRLWVCDTQGKVVFARWQITSRTAQDEAKAFSDLLAQKDRV